MPVLREWINSNMSLYECIESLKEIADIFLDFVVVVED